MFLTRDLMVLCGRCNVDIRYEEDVVGMRVEGAGPGGIYGFSANYPLISHIWTRSHSFQVAEDLREHTDAHDDKIQGFVTTRIQSCLGISFVVSCVT